MAINTLKYRRRSSWIINTKLAETFFQRAKVCWIIKILKSKDLLNSVRPMQSHEKYYTMNYVANQLYYLQYSGFYTQIP